MRGDSLRDLYAKTLALLGLGVLAGTGALVDYWPSGVPMPAIDTALVQPEIARSLPVPATQPNFEIPSAPARATRPLVNVELARAESDIPETPQLALAPTSDELLSIASLSAPPPVVVQTFAPSPDYTLGAEVTLIEPELAPRPIATLAMSTPPVTLAEDGNLGGRLTGVVKRTGTSIARTGRKTGASIVDAFRAMSGAVRRALPN